jgi:hypothetical protein
MLLNGNWNLIWQPNGYGLKVANVEVVEKNMDL